MQARNLSGLLGKLKNVLAPVCLALLACSFPASAQSLGSAGTVEGTITDASGAVIAGATATIVNRITGYQQTATTDSVGSFRLNNVPPNPYHLEVSAPGFATLQQDIVVRSAVPLTLQPSLQVAGGRTTVVVEAAGADVLENVPYAHNDMDRAVYSKLPTLGAGSGLSDAIIFASPGVVADSNGLFHPLGDHAQTTISIDGQPISDQQSKQFSTQLPLNAIQSMELITGAPAAEFGDKTSLVVNAVTRSGLGQSKPHGSFAAQYGSFGTAAEEFTLGAGSPKFGNFLAANALRSGRFLDTPEFRPLHARGNNQTIFDRIDYQPTGKNVFHLNLFAARNWFQTPNTFEQQFADQDQRQMVRSFNIAPGYQRTISPAVLLTITPFLRQDRVTYYSSRDPFSDTPITIGQSRRLRSLGFRADIAYVRGIHNLKFGGHFTNTGLSEDFHLGVTDPAFNAVCLDQGGDPVTKPTLLDPDDCADAGFKGNPDLQPGLIPFDLTRGGALFGFRGRADINQGGFFVQDQITLHSLTIHAGLRVDHYSGLSTDTLAQPRVGASYQIKPTGTVLRASYSRTLETPYNESLILSSSTGSGGLAQNTFGAFGAQPMRPGHRNQYNAGIQQALGKVLLVDADYFWKFTDNAYDFSALLNTPMVFPISWRKSKIDGVSLRLSTPNLRGFQAYTTMGHTRSRYFGPEVGGLIFNSPLDTSVFRIDHDQAFQQTTHVRYQRPKNGAWFAFTWRYDSGLVAGAVDSLEAALGLTAAQQAAIGFFCGGQRASLSQGITQCASSNFGATRLRIPAPGTADPDHNPPRVAPRHLFDLGAGTDNLFRRSEGTRVTLKFTVLNVTDKIALYNFLSTFSGTHFVAPRTYQAEVGVVF